MGWLWFEKVGAWKKKIICIVLVLCYMFMLQHPSPSPSLHEMVVVWKSRGVVKEIFIDCFSNVVHVYVSTLLPFHRLVRDYIVTLTMVLCEVLYFCYMFKFCFFLIFRLWWV